MCRLFSQFRPLRSFVYKLIVKREYSLWSLIWLYLRLWIKLMTVFHLGNSVLYIVEIQVLCLQSCCLFCSLIKFHVFLLLSYKIKHNKYTCKFSVYSSLIIHTVPSILLSLLVTNLLNFMFISVPLFKSQLDCMSPQI